MSPADVLDVIAALAAAMDQLTAAVTAQAAAVNPAAVNPAAVNPAAGPAPTAGAGGIGVGDVLGSIKTALGEVLGSIKTALGGLTEALSAPINALKSLVGVVAPFVEALSPSAVQAFNAAVRDAQATIGAAFIGVVNVATSLVQEISGVLLPVVQQLEPVLTQVANLLGTVFVSAIRLLVVPVQLLIPILDVVVGYFNEYGKLLADVIAIFTAYQKVLKDTIQSLFGTDTSVLKDVFKGMADTVRMVIKALFTLAATLAVAVGAAGYVGKFGDALAREAKDREERAAGLKAAGANPQVTDVAALARAAQLAAFTATGGGGVREKTEVDFLKELSGDLKQIAQNNKSLGDILKTWWNEQTTSGVFGAVVTAVKTFCDYYNGARDRISRFLGG